MILLAGLPVIWWVAILLADAIQPGRNLFELMEVLTEKLNHPFQFHYTEYTIKSMLVCTLLYAAGIGIFYSSQKNYRRGEEHGSARWGDARQICKKYSQKPYSQNILLTQNFRISLDTHKHRRCLNILVVGGSGAGKSRGFALPNIMQCCCSMVITDPKAELLRKTGGLLEKKGYEVRVFDLINPDTSFCYNPFEYVHDDKDVLRLISNLIQNTTPKGSQSSDPFWEKSETALLQALMLYLLHEAPPEEQNFAMIMEMLGSAQVKEEDEDYESPLDILFDRLEMRDPDSIAVKQYHIYKQAAGKTAKSILISVGVRLAAFNLPQIAKLTNTDELDLSNMGERKVALFCCIPDADTSLNYLVGMIYSQLFQTLYYMADRVHGGALPVPVNCIMDEFPNVSLPNEFEKILATCRSRSIYCSIIIQNMSQLKALFKDSWESLVGNCDEFLYLGGNEKETHKYVSELLGKETIDTNTYGQTKGKSGSYSTNFQQSGRELLQPDEVRMLDNQNALLFIRGERPILDAKDCLYKHDRQDMIIIYQPKTRRYEKPISRELAQLIGKAVSYANEHYPESIYIFADENKPERPISYQTLQDKVLRMIYEKDIRDDSGKLFGFGTHMFRHCYGVKLTELHVDDWTIAKLLGHKGVKSVQYYRKMSNQRLADETREVRNLMSQIILANLDGWGEEYEQIRQDAGIE